MLNRPGRLAISPWLGFAMVCFGVAFCLVSLVRHRDLHPGARGRGAEPAPGPPSPLILAAILALVGLAMAVHILTL